MKTNAWQKKREALDSSANGLHTYTNAFSERINQFWDYVRNQLPAMSSSTSFEESKNFTIYFGFYEFDSQLFQSQLRS
ncbi:hypothetical protein GE061_005582 [Apolygus lucorum]|uniref:Uncharacterized protein n=1 Tax=Apolygus lucorum TaxID=248454 RepID=A0A8S9X0M6_APOLU|nr:hypothetical protein GE061_005582 [Apolygus lucorum]